MENPYWHPFYKPHPIDFDDIRENCFKSFCILKASSALEGMAPEGIGEPTHKYFFQNAEAKLSSHLLDIAIRMRTLEDILKNHRLSGMYGGFIETISDTYNLGSIHGGVNPSDSKDLTFREACNKIIHAEDLRYVYDNGSNDRDGDFAWGMTGVLEMSGKIQSKDWDVWLSLEDFLSMCLEIADRFDVTDPD